MMDKSDINTLQVVVIPNTYRNKPLLGMNILENFMQYNTDRYKTRGIE